MTAKQRVLRLWETAETRLPVAGATARPPFRLQTAHDVLGLLEEQIGAVRAAPGVGPLAKARAIGRLAGLALKAVEVGQLAARLEMLEAVLKQRDGGRSDEHDPAVEALRGVDAVGACAADPGGGTARRPGRA